MHRKTPNSKINRERAPYKSPMVFKNHDVDCDMVSQTRSIHKRRKSIKVYHKKINKENEND